MAPDRITPARDRSPVLGQHLHPSGCHVCPNFGNRVPSGPPMRDSHLYLRARIQSNGSGRQQGGRSQQSKIKSSCFYHSDKTPISAADPPHTGPRNATLGNRPCILKPDMHAQITSRFFTALRRSPKKIAPLQSKPNLPHPRGIAFATPCHHRNSRPMTTRP